MVDDFSTQFYPLYLPTKYDAVIPGHPVYISKNTEQTVRFHSACRSPINSDRHPNAFPVIARSAHYLQTHLSASYPDIARFAMKMAKIYIFIVFLPHLSCPIQGQVFQCSEYFTYMTEPGTTNILGQIKIPAPSANDAFYLKVALNTTIESLIVRLELARSIQESVRHVYQGRPLLYHVYHSMHKPIPSLSAIWFNNRRYCPGSEVSANITANVELGHILYPPNEKPLGYYGSWSQISQPWYRNVSSYRIDNPSYDRLNYNSVLNNECGITSYYTDDTNRLISDGEKALPGQWPWLVAIYHANTTYGSFLGTGSILTTRHVITVGKNWLPTKPDDVNNIYVSFGQLNSRQWHENHTGIINRVIADYKFNGDLVILIIKMAIEYNAFIKPVCLWSGSTNLQDIVNMTGYVVGWGSDNYYEFGFRHSLSKLYTEELRMAKVPLMNLSINNFEKNMFDYNTPHPEYPCYTDPGGALVIFNTTTNRYQLRGVTYYCTAWGITRYVDVAKQISWIRQQISIT